MNTKDPPDEVVIAESLGRPEAFAVIFERHHAAVHAYARRRLGGEAPADDLAAEVFAHAFRGRRRYRPLTDDARPWLLGIATRQIAQQRRTESRALRAYERVGRRDATDAGHAAPAPEQVARERVPAELAGALRALARRDREALLLYAWGELSYAEIAVALDVPVGTVRSRINRARRRLQGDRPDALPTNFGEAHA